MTHGDAHLFVAVCSDLLMLGQWVVDVILSGASEPIKLSMWGHWVV